MFPEISNIKIRRQRLGIKQGELAELSKVSQSMITKLEKGKLEPSYTIAKRIFLALDSLEHKKENKCSDIMTSKLLFAKKGDKIEKAAELMKRHFIDQLPILEGKRVVGSISEYLIFSKLMQIDKKKLLNMEIKEIMQEPFPIVNYSMPVSVVLPMLKTADAILVSENSEIKGIITKANLI